MLQLKILLVQTINVLQYGRTTTPIPMHTYLCPSVSLLSICTLGK